MSGPIQSIERAAAVLRLLAPGPAGLSELAGALGLPKPTVHGIVRTLCDVGFVEQESSTGRYRLGPGLSDLGDGAVDGNVLRSRAMNWTDRLAAHTELEVQLAVPHEDSALVVHHVFRPDDSPQRLVTGELRPLHATALGKVLLAHVPGAGPVRSLPLDRFCAGTRTDRTVILAELEEVRRRGWAVEAGEHRPGLAAVAAPVRGTGGITIGSLAVLGPHERILDAGGVPPTALVRELVRTAREITRELAAHR